MGTPQLNSTIILVYNEQDTRASPYRSLPLHIIHAYRLNVLSVLIIFRSHRDDDATGFRILMAKAKTLPAPDQSAGTDSCKEWTFCQAVQSDQDSGVGQAKKRFIQ